MAIIYSYPSSSPLLSDLMIISRTPSNPNETANYSISLEDLAGLLSGTGTVTSFSATSTIPGITTTVATATTTPSLTIGITGAPAAGTYLDNTGNFTTPAGGGGGGGTLQQVLQAGNTTGNNKIFAQGGASGGMNFADNTLLTFGTGNDLSIKHSSVSGESEILETGTGGLTITGSSTITFKAGLLGDTYAVFNDNGAVSLRHNNVVKFETTTDGIKVADRIEASTTNANLQVQGNGTGFLEVRSADATTPGTIQLNCEQNSHGVSIQSPAHSAGATYTLKLPTTVGTNTQVLQTDGNNPAQLSWVANAGGGSGVTGTGVAGRATFWTGASTVSSDASFLWDSTNDRLGIGTVAPLQAIDVTGAGKYYGLNGKAFASTTSTTADPMQIGDISGVGFPLQLLDNTGTSVLHVTGGNVGIGTTTPSQKLYVNGNLLVIGAFLDSNSQTGTAGQVLSSTVTGTDWIPNLTLTTTGTSGAATLNATTRVLNIPQYSGGGGGDTYDLNAGAKVGINVPLNLTSGSGSDNSLVTLSEGSGITLTRNSATQITIASSGGGGGATDINGLSDAYKASSRMALGINAVGSNASTNTIILATTGTSGQNLGAANANIVVGNAALTYTTTGGENIAVGSNALFGNSGVAHTGSSNVGIGVQSLFNIQGAADKNTVIGGNAMGDSSSTTSGSSNVAIGNYAGSKIGTGSYNTAVGASAGQSTNLANQNYCINLGYQADSSTTYGAVIRIGNGNAAFEAASQCIIGNASLQGGITPSIRPVTNNQTDLGTSAAKYKDIYYDGILQSGTLNIAPASATASGTTGEIRFTADYIYVCVATNTWKRTAISTW